MSSVGNIYLIGFSGTGKTLSGIKAAELLRMPFVDMDELIQYRTRKSIPEIFEEDGEDAFRNMETELLEELSQKSSRVVSTGGGVPVREVNREIMGKTGVIILLTASPETIHQRLVSRSTRGRALRPLLGSDAPAERVEDLLASRESAYACARASIDTEKMTHDEVAQEIERVWMQDRPNTDTRQT